MSKKIIDKIDLVKDFCDLEKFVKYKKEIKEEISSSEFLGLAKIRYGKHIEKDLIEEIFNLYSGDISVHIIFGWLSIFAKECTISKNVVKKIFSSRIIFSNGFNKIEFIESVYGGHDLYGFFIKCEDGAIDFDTADKIFTKMNFDKRYSHDLFRISQGLYEKAIRAFDNNAKKIFESKLKDRVFKFDFESIARPKNFKEFDKLFETQFKNLFMETKNWLKIFSLVPDFKTERHVRFKFFCDNNLVRNAISDMSYDAYGLKKEKLSIAKLKALVLCNVGIRACGLLLEFIPDKIDHVFLYWLSIIYERTHVYEGYAWFLSTECDDHITANRRTANFYADRFSGTINQYSLRKFINIFKNGAITESSAEKFLKNLKFIKGEQIEFGDQDYNKMLTKFTDAGKKVFEKYFLLAKTIEPEDYVSS